MQLRATSVLVGLVFSATLAAQGAVPPFVVSQVNPHPGIAAGPVPGSNVQQVHFIHLPGDPPELFYCATTAAGLSSAFGGSGGSDLLCGSYDVLTDTFTPNSEAGALNTTGTEFGLMLHHSGVFAAFDRLPGAPWLASRTAPGQPWTIVGQIGPIPSQSYYDPALANYQGQPHLLHVLGSDIAMTPIDLGTGLLIGPSVVIVNPAQPGSVANSPTPVLDPNGELIGVSHHDLLGSDNDHYMSLDLDPTTPSILLNDTATWTNNGGFIGGRFFDAEYTPAPYHTLSMDAFWFTGGRSPVGATMWIRMFTPPTSGSEVYLSLFAASSSFTPTGVPLPPLLGLLGVNAAGVVASPLILHDNRNGEAVGSFTIPNDPGLSGVRLPAQALTLEAVSGVVRLANTAMIVVD